MPYRFGDLPLLSPGENRPSAPSLPWPMQAKLKVGAVNDPLEREADRVAEHVMRMPAPVPLPSGSSGEIVQRKCTACAQPEEQQTVRRKCDSCEEADNKKKNEETHEKLARKESSGSTAMDGSSAPAIVHDVVNSAGQPLDPATRAFMEPRFGRDFSRVRVHADAAASRSAEAVGAKAYTAGSNVVFRRGEFAPETTTGQRLLAHELAHVVQQRAADHRDAGLARMLQRQADAPIPWGTLPRGPSQVYEVKPGDYLRKIAEMFYGDPMQWPRIYAENKDVIGPDPDKISSGQTLIIPAGGGTGIGCKPVVTYGRPRALHFGPSGTCGAAIQYQITNVAASGKGCPPSLAGLAITETVTSDHGCGSRGSVTTGSFIIGPGGAMPPGANDTYGFFMSKSAVPPCELPCTEKYFQSLFVGGMYADSHVISFTMCGSASSCSTVVDRDGVLVGIVS